MKLNGWQRFGVVLSVLWLLIALFFDPLGVSGGATGWWLLAIFFLQILVFWIIAYATLFAFRWVRKGFVNDHESIPTQSQITAPLAVDSSIPQSHQLDSAPQPQHQLKKKGFITRASSGEERLWIVFWIYTFFGGWLLIFIGNFFIAYGAAVAKNSRSTALIIIGLSIILSIFYIVWAFASSWKCAFNVKNKSWGYLARAYIVWCVCVFIYNAWSLWSR